MLARDANATQFEIVNYTNFHYQFIPFIVVNRCVVAAANVEVKTLLYPQDVKATITHSKKFIIYDFQFQFPLFPPSSSLNT